MKNYRPPEIANWQGRKTSAPTPQYWHEAIGIADLSHGFDSVMFPDVALLGYACDEGVIRNQGRPGAKYGPKLFRERLAKLAFHHAKKIVDLGDIYDADGDMEGCQDDLGTIISELLNRNIRPIVIGGGHDVAYGHFLGIAESNIATGKKIGIINFDAHFDLRAVETLPNSGTPFWQILNTYESVDYLPIGIQRASNPKELFQTATELKVDFISSELSDYENTSQVITLIEPFIKENDLLYVTIDLDGFASPYAPGVSAPSPLGFKPEFVMKVLAYLCSTNKVVSCDIAELNPQYDMDNMTANLAARLTDMIIGYS